MTYTECSAGQKSPLLTPKPLIVLDKICISKYGVKGEEGDSIKMIVPRQPDVQSGALNFG